ncbi:MAG: hypothetical protein JO001_28435 [Alphaproteobacteria bacterium]|nr:hypothetical protein [Alphaproteobacteria bacterium]
MHDASYYRDQAARLRGFARQTRVLEVARDLQRLASDFEDVADDLEAGAIEIVYPDLLPQRRRPPLP